MFYPGIDAYPIEDIICPGDTGRDHFPVVFGPCFKMTEIPNRFFAVRQWDRTSINTDQTKTLPFRYMRGPGAVKVALKCVRVPEQGRFQFGPVPTQCTFCV